METGITLLIIDADEEYAKGLKVFASSRKEFLEVEYAINGKDGFELMKIMKPDAVIIDFLVPGLDAIGFLRSLKNNPPTKKPLIVVSSFAMLSTMLNIASDYNPDYIMVKPQPYSEVCNTVSDLLSSSAQSRFEVDYKDNNFIDVTISKFLHTMGIPAHLNGYRYIRKSLELAINDISILTPITKHLYPQLASEFHKNPCCIERAIRHAIKVSWERGNKKLIHDIFGYSPGSAYTGCPTNSEYIAMLADDLKLRLRHNIAI